MLFREIFRLMGLYLFGFAFFLLIPIGVAGYYQFFDTLEHHPQPHTTIYFFYTLLITLALGFLGYFAGKKTKPQLYRREGIAAVVLIWLITPAISALPFVLSGTLENPLQAYFEMASGYTTTGASIMAPKAYDPETGQEMEIVQVVPGVHDTTYRYYGTIAPVRDPETGKIIASGVEAVSKALLFWRSFSQWLGGLGVVVLFVAILPALGVGGKLLYQAEVPGPVKEGVTPRIKETAIQLWKIYLFISVLEIGALIWVNPNLEWLDLFTITFSTVSTGGFSIKNESIAGYHSFGTEMVVLVFFLLGSLNFTLYYFSFRGKFYRLKDPELILYLIVLVLASLVISFSILGTPKMNMDGVYDGVFSLGEAFRYGVFQAASIQTSTGFTTTNYDIWPYFPQVLLLILMYVGGMSGSTAGGMKMIRHYMVFRIAQYRVESIFRPESVRVFKVGGREVDVKAASMVFVFFVIVIALSMVATLFFVADGCDPETSLGMVACFINNIGVAFRAASPINGFAFLSEPSLVMASLVMILGRLEFFAFLAVLVPAFWKQDS
ncbi:MAG: TrkH family potassium uptake protein [Chlamydiia bacterium]|nr:TrkH family potassium uptake protein [Chlamydiia bacterium]